MTKQSKINNRKSTTTPSTPDLLFLTCISSAVSLFALLYYFERGEILLYGDALAHVNIARRVFDSQTPGLLQLGTVWLPLPHLLMVPLLTSDVLWRSGLGGAIPSMLAYVFGTVGIFRFTRGVLQGHESMRPSARAGAWIAALVYGANPNLIYLQTTAMTEVLYLALSIWATLHFSEWVQTTTTTEATEEHRGRQNSLWKCALCLAAAELTRYDGWFLAAVIGSLVLIVTVRGWRDPSLRLVTTKFLLAIAAAPGFWLAYNAAVYGDPLEFARGPYSAKAIELRTAKPGYPAHPGSDEPIVASTFFLKSAQLNMAPGNWGRMWIAVVLLAIGAITVRFRAAWMALLLLVPVFFYALSIAYSGVPLFVPTWWPFSWYNLRYGLQLLPLFAVASAVILASVPIAAEDFGGLSRLLKRSPDTRLRAWWERNSRIIVTGALVLAVGISYGSVWRAQPVSFTEAWVNSRTKLSLETSVARVVSMLPPESRFLMYLGDHVGVFQQLGIPLRRVIHEGNHRPWVRPEDPEGLWERALANPVKFVDFVIAYQGDAVDQKVNRKDLKLFNEIHVTGQPHARIYSVQSP